MALNLDNQKDLNFIILYFLVGLVLLALVVVNTNTAIQNAVTVYSNIFYFSFGLILFAIFLGKDSEYIGFKVFGSDQNVSNNQGRVLLGMIFGLGIGFFIVNNFFTLFSINFIPQSLVTVSDNSTIFFLLFVGPLAEEVLFRGLLIPTFKKIIKKLHMPFMFTFFAVIILGFTSYYAIAFLLIILAVVFFIFKSLDSMIVNNLALLGFMAILFSATAFAIYHVRAYADQASPQTAIIGAFLFGMLAGYFMEFSGTLVMPAAMHVVANATTYVNSNPGSLAIALLIVGGFAGLVLLAYGFTRKVRFQQIESIQKPKLGL